MQHQTVLENKTIFSFDLIYDINTAAAAAADGPLPIGWKVIHFIVIILFNILKKQNKKQKKEQYKQENRTNVLLSSSDWRDDLG